MNRNLKSVSFMREINPLLSDGSISNKDAAFLVKEYRNGKFNIISSFLETADVDETIRGRIETFLNQG